MRIRNDLELQDVEDILMWYNNINPEKTVEIANYLKDQAEAGEQIFYDIYTEEEKAEDPAKENTGLFFFRGEPQEKFALVNASGGFAYVAAMHDSFPHALELSKKGYLGLHWCIFVRIAGKRCGKSSAVRTWSVRFLEAAIAIYGIYAFFKRAIGTYMFLQVHFAFFDYEEPIFLFLLDYLAVMGLFVFAGHYIGYGLKRKKKNKEF